MLRSSLGCGCLQDLLLRSDGLPARLMPLLGWEPVVRADLYTRPVDPAAVTDFDELAACPQLRVVTRLLLNGPQPDQHRLLPSPHLTRLAELKVGTLQELETLAGLAAPPPVTRLHVEPPAVPDRQTTTRIARLLADTPWFARLQVLSVQNAGFGAAECRVLVGSPHLSPRLHAHVYEYAHRRLFRPGSPLARDFRARFAGAP